MFNLLDARGAISVTERVGVIQRVRNLAVGVARAWVDQQSARERMRPPPRYNAAYAADCGVSPSPRARAAAKRRKLRMLACDFVISACSTSAANNWPQNRRKRSISCQIFC